MYTPREIEIVQPRAVANISSAAKINGNSLWREGRDTDNFYLLCLPKTRCDVPRKFTASAITDATAIATNWFAPPK
jgi:hypothetical protein